VLPTSERVLPAEQWICSTSETGWEHLSVRKGHDAERAKHLGGENTSRRAEQERAGPAESEEEF